jgi:hypothetical protein
MAPASSQHQFDARLRFPFATIVIMTDTNRRRVCARLRIFPAMSAKAAIAICR